MTNPQICLAIDNCFAVRRWVTPREWVGIVKDLGLTYVEANADNECDPLYAAPAYLEDWLQGVQEACAESGVKVANLYSGHNTYNTLGLAHYDRRNQERIQNQWMVVMIDNAARLGAGLGFFCHAFCERILQNPTAYAREEDGLYDRLAELADYACQCGGQPIGIEQMYSPHQIPWTLTGARKLLREVYAKKSCPLYITLDTGHQSGQQRFLRPTVERLKSAVAQLRATGKLQHGLWLGSDSAYACLREAAAGPEAQEHVYLQRVEQEMDRFPYLFAVPEDGDIYTWLEQLACYSPIIHLQQTNGKSSPHWPFTEEYNRQGIVRADKVLEAIATAYSRETEPGMPPPSKVLYLTLEVYPATTDFPIDIIAGLTESVAYWRKWVPKDGLPLDELLHGAPSGRVRAAQSRVGQDQGAHNHRGFGDLTC